MKDPVRMLDGDASDVERALLLAGAAEEPPPDGARRLAATLGVSTALLGAAKAAASAAASGATASAGTGAAASASTPPGAAAAVSPFAAGLALKWLALAGGGAAIAAAVLVMRSSNAPRLPEQDAAGRAPHGLREPAPDVSGTAPALRGGAVSIPAEPRALDPAQPAKAAVPADRAAREASPRPRPDAARGRPKSIAREIEQLDAARDLLQRGQARAALSVLDAYRRDHEQGVLDQEAALLRIEALSRAGERAAARRNAERFLRDNPKSPHEDRIRALVGSGSDGR